MIFHFTSGLENEGLFTNRRNGKHYVLGKSTLSGMEGPFRPPLSENRDSSGTVPLLDLRPVCKFKFVRCGPVEKKKHSIFLGLIVAALQSSRTPFSE